MQLVVLVVLDVLFLMVVKLDLEVYFVFHLTEFLEEDRDVGLLSEHVTSLLEKTLLSSLPEI